MKKNNAKNFNETMIDFFCENYVNGSMKEYAENTKDILFSLHAISLDVKSPVDTEHEDMKKTVENCRAKLLEAKLAYAELAARAGLLNA